MPAIQILIADDETMLRRLLARRLSSEPDFRVVGEAENGKQAVEQALKLRPDIVVMDLNMPLLSGAQATERVLAELPATQVIMLTSLGDLAPMARYVGAAEYLDKSCTPEELVAAIRRVHSGRDSRESGSSSNDHVNAVELIAARVALTEYEKVVLQKVVSTDLTVHQIATALSREEDKAVTDSSVKHALDRVMTKLKVEPRTRAAVVKRVLEAQRQREEQRGP